MNKHPKVLVVALVLAFLAFRASAQTNTPSHKLYLIGVPHEMAETTGKTILATTLTLLAKARTGDRVMVFDALELQLIVDITKPELPNASNTKALFILLATEIAALRRHFLQPASVGSGQEDVIRLPQFLDLATSALKTSSGNATLVLFGKPYYVDPRDPAFAFGEGVYPSDGHILADSKKSVFGTSDKLNLLKGTVLHMCYLKERFQSDLERTAIRRFWMLYAGRLGSVLATFVASPEVTLERALSGVADPVARDVLDPKDTVLEMRTINARRPPEVAVDPTTRPVPAPAAQNEAREEPATPRDVVMKAELGRIQKPAPGFVRFAVAWTARGNAAAADVDLYVRPSPTAAELYYSNTSTPEGNYLRDIRSARPRLDDTSWVVSWEVVEIKTADIDESSCWLNLYRGSGGVIEGIVRVLWADRIADQPFSFPALDGDSGRNTVNRSKHPCWLAVDLKKLNESVGTAPTPSK